MGDMEVHKMSVPHAPSTVHGVDDTTEAVAAGQMVPPHVAPSAVNAFMGGKNVLITGGSGFIGKVGKPETLNPQSHR